jgi:hypothetical protein
MELITDTNDNMDLGEKQSYDRLIDGKDIRFKTEINYEQRCVISSIETSIEHFKKKGINLNVANRFVLTFIDMGASVGRQSRKEIVEALKAKVDAIEREYIANKQAQQLK